MDIGQYYRDQMTTDLSSVRVTPSLVSGYIETPTPWQRYKSESQVPSIF